MVFCFSQFDPSPVVLATIYPSKTCFLSFIFHHIHTDIHMIQYHRNVMSDYANVQYIMSITKYHRFVPPLMSKADIPDGFSCDSHPRWQGLEPAEVHAALREASRGAAGAKLRLSSLQVARHHSTLDMWGMVTTTGLENLGTMGIWKIHGKILNLKHHFPSSDGDFASILSTPFRHPHQGLCQAVHRLLVQKRGQFEGYEEGGHIMAGWTGRWGKWIESNRIWCLKLIFP